MDLAGGGARDDGDDILADADLEAVVPGGHGDGLAGVDHADVDALGGHHDLPSLRHAALHCNWPGGRRQAAARRAPRSRGRSGPGTGHAMMRSSTQS